MTHIRISPSDEVTIGGHTYRGERIAQALEVVYSICVAYAMTEERNGGARLNLEFLDEVAEKCDKIMARRKHEIDLEAQSYNDYTPPRKPAKRAPKGGSHGA